MIIRTAIRATKGGQGCSTVTAMLALAHARLGRSVRVVSNVRDHDVRRVLGAGDVQDHTDIGSGIIHFDDGDDALNIGATDVVLYDAGTFDQAPLNLPSLWVIRNEYLAMMSIADHPLGISTVRDTALFVIDHRRPLTTHDMLAVIGNIPHHTIDLDPVIARGCDAGLLTTRTTHNQIFDKIVTSST